MRKNLVFIYSIIALLLMSCGQSYEEKKRLSKAERAEQQRADSLALKVAVLPTLDCMPILRGKGAWFFRFIAR